MDSANDISGNVEQVHQRRKKIRTIAHGLGVKPEDAGFWKPYSKPSEKNTESVDEFTHPSNNKNGTNNAGKIFGCLEPPTVNDSIVHNTRGTLGAKVASREFQRAVLKHTMFDSYHFLQGVKTESAIYPDNQPVCGYHVSSLHRNRAQPGSCVVQWLYLYVCL